MSKRNYNRAPLDLPTPKTGRRRGSNRGRPRSSSGTEEDASPIYSKIFIALIIIIVVMIAKHTNSDFSQKVVGHLRKEITKDMDMDETLGKLKFVNSYLADAKAVFGIQEPDGIPDEGDMVPQGSTGSFAIPAEGKVAAVFGPDNSGIDIIGKDNPKVYAVSEGKVVSTGDNNKGEKYIRISHRDNLISLYEGCSQVQVQAGDSLQKGDPIGTMGQDSAGLYWMHFEVWLDGKPIDPLKMIENNTD